MHLMWLICGRRWRDTEKRKKMRDIEEGGGIRETRKSVTDMIERREKIKIGRASCRERV